MLHPYHHPTTLREGGQREREGRGRVEEERETEERWREGCHKTETNGGRQGSEGEREREMEEETQERREGEKGVVKDRQTEGGKKIWGRLSEGNPDGREQAMLAAVCLSHRVALFSAPFLDTYNGSYRGMH